MPLNRLEWYTASNCFLGLLKIFLESMGFQWALSEARDYDAYEYHGCFVTYP
jgi:hypothetical protein